MQGIDQWRWITDHHDEYPSILLACIFTSLRLSYKKYSSTMYFTAHSGLTYEQKTHTFDVHSDGQN